MEGQKPHQHGHQPQSEEEAVIAAAAAATGDVVEELMQPLPVQEEVMEAAGGDADHQFDFVVDSIAVGEAFAHALRMEELAQVEVWDLVAPGAEGPAAVLAAPAAGSQATQPNVNFHRQEADAVPRHVPTGQDVDMHDEPLYSYQELHAAAADRRIFASAQAFVVDRAARAIAANNNQHAAPAKATSNQPAGTAAAGVPQPQDERGAGHVLSSSTYASAGLSVQGMRRRPSRQQPVGGGGEVITLRLEIPAGGGKATSRTVPGPGAGAKEGIISARQAILADAARSPAVLLAGIDEEEYGNGWYDSIVHQAQGMEAMDEPGLNDQVRFQQQSPRFDEEPREEEPGNSAPKRLRIVVHPSDLDLDEAARPSTRPARVLPLADDEVPKFDCGICMETLPVLDLFHDMQCQHRFCVECMATYIEGRINGGEVPIPCPDPACPEAYGEDIAVLHPEVCKKAIDFAAFSSWGDRLTEHAIPPNRRAYCPNRRCGVLLEATGGKTPARAFCPACGHPMCATCGFDWSHDDADDGSSRHDCSEGTNGALLQKLAKERRWKQCPRCKFLVEKIAGCNIMQCRLLRVIKWKIAVFKRRWLTRRPYQCRCKFVFCYGCGLPRGRQTGMEQGAQLCRCQDADMHAVQ